MIRERLLCQLDADGKTMPLAEGAKSPGDDDATPLAAAIGGFNEQHRSDGVPQPPLTEEEVVAAIRWWKTRRNEAPVTNREFATFQKIAETRQLPKGVALEVISHFGRVDGSSHIIWSVRIVVPRESREGWTYAYTIREQYVHPYKRSERSDDDIRIAWGAAGSNGLQVGFRLEPRNELYATGQQVTPVFIIGMQVHKSWRFHFRG